MHKMGKYWALYKLSFLQALRNYKALMGLSVFLMTCLVIFAHLWKIAASKVGVVAYDASQLLWYIAFNEWVLISIPDIQDDMEQDLRSGRLAYLLPRPISYLGSTFAEALGALTVNMTVLGLVTVAFTWYQAGGFPFSPGGILVAIFFGVMASVVAVVFHILIGLSAFWLHEVRPFFWIWEKLLFTLGGLMLPLAVYPEWIQHVAQMTPFPAILGDRSALAFDLSMERVLVLSVSLLFWGAVGMLGVMIAYRRGLRILNVEGG